MLAASHVGIDERELATPTSTAKYPLGMTVDFVNTSDNVTERYVYAKAHAALTQYAPYMVAASATAGSEVVTASPTTITAESARIGVPQVAFTSSYYGFLKVRGNSSVVSTTGIPAAGYGKAIPGSATAVAGALPTTTTFCTSYSTTTALASVYLMDALVSIST